MSQEYEVIIGLEVHAELKTDSKIFCSCSNTFGAEPNTNVCPVCSGFPGMLPVLNRKVVELAVKTGLALNCEIADYCKFDRKNYFYPDLPKAYQISQFDLPICKRGYLDIDINGEKKRIGITRAHMEEDAGKLVHQGSITSTPFSLVDLNRSGVPLLEIVSEPDMRSAGEAGLIWKNCGLFCFLPVYLIARCRKDRCAVMPMFPYVPGVNRNWARVRKLRT